MEKIANLTGSNITIQRIFIQSIDAPVSFSGQAASQAAILGFKDALGRDPEFSDVNLPLSSISPVSGGLLNFTLSFKIKEAIRK